MDIIQAGRPGDETYALVSVFVLNGTDIKKIASSSRDDSKPGDPTIGKMNMHEFWSIHEGFAYVRTFYFLQIVAKNVRSETLSLQYEC
jgi:hypothetical protein